MAPPDAPYSGPWYGPSNRVGAKQYRGPAAVALKRSISRGWPNLLEWKRFDDVYNLTLERAVREVQRKAGITPHSGQTGRKTFSVIKNRKVPPGHPNSGEWAIDWVAKSLFEDAWDIAHPPQPPAREIVKDAIADYWQECVRHASAWHYSQQRPGTSIGKPPTGGGWDDCSFKIIAAHGWVRMETGIHVPDPSGYGFAGYGNSQSLYEHNKGRTVGGSYEVGDIAVYGPSYRTRHVTQCIDPGTASDAVWGSNGSEAAPNLARLLYRTDLLCVVRPLLIQQ